MRRRWKHGCDWQQALTLLAVTAMVAGAAPPARADSIMLVAIKAIAKDIALSAVKGAAFLWLRSRVCGSADLEAMLDADILAALACGASRPPEQASTAPAPSSGVSPAAPSPVSPPSPMPTYRSPESPDSQPATSRGYKPPSPAYQPPSPPAYHPPSVPPPTVVLWAQGLWTTRQLSQCSVRYYTWRVSDRLEISEFVDQSGQLDVERTVDILPNQLFTETISSNHPVDGQTEAVRTRWRYEFVDRDHVNVTNLRTGNGFKLTRCPG